MVRGRSGQQKIDSRLAKEKGDQSGSITKKNH